MLHLPRFGLLCSALIACLATSCLSKNPALAVRYFEPARAPIRTQERVSELQLVDVVGARSRAETRMVWRISPVEVAFDEQNRWTVEPTEYARAAILQALFASGAFSSDSNADARLRVELVEFEGVRSTASARVRLHASLDTRNQALRQQSFEAQLPLEGTGASALARAMGLALDEAAIAIAEWIAND